MALLAIGYHHVDITYAAVSADVQVLASQELICNGANVSERWYLGDTRYPRDRFSGGNGSDWAFSYSRSSVGLYNPAGHLSLSGSFDWYSNGKPKNINEVIVMQNASGTTLISHPASRNDLVGQFVYKIHRLPSDRRIGGSFLIGYTDLSYNYREVSVVDFDGTWQTDNECYNIYAAWCGDGVLDATDGEVCDPADPAKAGFGVGGCDAACKPVDTPVPPLCSSSISGALDAQITAGACDSGTPINFASGGTNPINYTWNCTNGVTTTPACRASYTPNNNTPACNSITVNPTSGAIPLSSTITCATSNATTVSIDCGNGQNIVGSTGVCTYATVGTFAPRCSVNGNITSPACLGSVTTTATPPPPVPYVSIKKTVQGVDGQTLLDAAQVTPGSDFRYNYDVTNTGTVAATGVTVTDTFPQYISVTALPTGRDWTCSTGSKTLTGVTYATVICKYDVPLPAGSSASQITVPARLDLATPPGSALRNIAYVCRTGDTRQECNPACIDPNLPACTPSPPPPDCSPIAGSPNYDPACVYVTAVSIKKYAQGLDGQTLTGAASVVAGSNFNYLYVVTNAGNTAATGVIVTDTLPQYVSVISITPPAGWSCATGSKASLTTIICTTASLAARSVVNITITANLAANTPANSQIRNIVYVCKPGDPVTPNCTPGCVDPNLPACTPPPPPPDCSPMASSPNYDPACVTPVNASCSALASVPSGSPIPTNVDVLYTCSATGSAFVPSNLEYSIKCGAGDTSAGAAYTGANTRICRTPNTTSTTQAITCAVRDRTNPNVIFTGSDVGACRVEKTTLGGGGGGTPIYYSNKCVNGAPVPTCALVTGYSNPAECARGQGSECYDTLQGCDVARRSLSCPGPGGSSGFCGDGVLQSGEECDIPNVSSCGQRGEVDSNGNSIACKLKIFTIPGANPITDIWMTIPLLSKNSKTLGYSWLDGVAGRIRFEENRMVLGVGTRAFTLADTVGFGIKRGYNVPLIIKANKLICLRSIGTAINSARVCTTFGDLATSSMKPWNLPEYVLIGNGDYQVRQSDGTYLQYTMRGNSNTIDLFKGAREYSSKRFASIFSGVRIGTGMLELYHASTTTGQPIDLVALDVKVTGAMVGTDSATVSRKLETYINSQTIVDSFLSGFSAYTTTTTNTTSTPVGGGSTALTTVTIGGKDAPATGANFLGTGGLDAYRLNGNENIFSIRGNVTMDCTSYITATIIKGVRTLIVEGGDLTLNCNMLYPSDDLYSSWAFIVKGGDIRIATGVTNIAGVYVTIPDAGRGGKFTPSLSGATTNEILRVNGSLYGNADDLFRSRQYVRGTTAYDVITTGVIVSYSNRALMYPPPLLSQYLNNYSVTRVVR